MPPSDSSNGDSESTDSEDGPELHADRQPATVKDVYDQIATHFAKTRAYPWPEVSAFLDSLDDDSRPTYGIDIGCGNGRHTIALAEVVDCAIGVDISAELLATASARIREAESEAWPFKPALIQADATTLPIPRNHVGVGLYVATVHHLPDRETRVESLRELRRVLSPGGRALVSAWSTAHDRFDDAEESFDTTIDWTLPDGETVPRFYHIYSQAEFEADLERAGLEVADVFVSSGNCYAEIVGTDGEGKHP